MGKDAEPAGHSFVGVDLGWSSGATGMAVVDDTGRLTASSRVQTDGEVADWLAAYAGHVVVAAVDAPLIVPNETGQRVPERLIGQTSGAFGASAHTSNRARFGGTEPRAMRLARRFGWAVDPQVATGGHICVCIEVYPHPAVGLFELGYRLDYKKGDDRRRSPGFALLLTYLELISELRLEDNPRWHLSTRGAGSQPSGKRSGSITCRPVVACSWTSSLCWHRANEDGMSQI